MFHVNNDVMYNIQLSNDNLMDNPAANDAEDKFYPSMILSKSCSCPLV